MMYESYKRRAYWETKFALIPRRCDLSRRWIWGRHVRGEYSLSGPGDPIPLVFWHHRDEHIIFKLKGN
jgi:hypothetical protein